MSEKKTYWKIMAAVETEYKVIFDEPVTREEAMERFMNDDIEDVVDEDSYSVLEVLNAS